MILLKASSLKNEQSKWKMNDDSENKGIKIFID
jgi:hypothetical protein